MSKQLKSPATLGSRDSMKSEIIQYENKGFNGYNFQELSQIIDEIKQEDELKKHYKIQKLMLFFNYPVQEFKTVQNLEIKTSKRENKRKKIADFRTKLLYHHPDLTDAEIHLVDLIIKEKNCTEIGEILDLTPGTVRVYKNKLKTKLNLTSENNLGVYLIELYETYFK
jgi:DNA-binding CsgD family transcriptional regulator